MSAVLDAVVKPATDTPPAGKKKGGWPRGVPRGPRAKATEGQDAATTVKPKRAKKHATKAGEIAENWTAYKTDYLKKDGNPEIEARKAYHKGASDVLMLLGKHVGAESVPPAFMGWIEQCQRGLLGKD
jgi:hypothetical protein